GQWQRPVPKPTLQQLNASKPQATRKVSMAATLTSRNPVRAASDSKGSLIATGLRKTYGKRTVVHDVSLSVDSGEVVGLLGPNGAGKTTSFYMIVGIVPTDA